MCAIAMTVFTLAVNLLPMPTSKEIWKHTGNVSNLVMPIMAGVCAHKKGDLPRYIATQAAGMSIVKLAKNGFGKSELNRRPNGGSRGVVSGHSQFTATSVMYLTMNRCHEAKWNWVLHYVTALSGYSRVGANAHSPIQAIRGIIIGYLVVYIFNFKRVRRVFNSIKMGAGLFNRK